MFNLSHSTQGQDPIAFLQSIRTIMSNLKMNNQALLHSQNLNALSRYSIPDLINTRTLLQTLWSELLELDDQCLSASVEEKISAEALSLDEVYDDQKLSVLLMQGMAELATDFRPFPANWSIKNRKYGLLLKRIYYDLWEIECAYKQLKNLIQSQSAPVIFELYCDYSEQTKRLETLKDEFSVFLDTLDLQLLRPQVQAIQMPSMLMIFEHIVNIQERETELMQNQGSLPCEQFLIETFQLYKEISNLFQTAQFYFSEPANQVPLVFLKQRMLRTMTAILNNEVKIDANQFYISHEYQRSLFLKAWEQCKLTLSSLLNYHAHDFTNEALMHSFQQRNPNDRAILKLFLHFSVGKQTFFPLVEYIFNNFDGKKIIN